MLNPVARIGPGKFLVRNSECVQDVINGRISIAMDRNPMSSSLVCSHDFHEPFPWT